MSGWMVSNHFKNFWVTCLDAKPLFPKKKLETTWKPKSIGFPIL